MKLLLSMQKMILFEEFNPYTGKQFAEKLKIYAEASENTLAVSHIVSKGEYLTFYIHTNLPGDYVNNAKKIFLVIIPVNTVEKSRVKTFEGGKQVLEVNLEPLGENDINLILINFIEATGLFNDTATEFIVDNYKKARTPEDIKKLIKTLTDDTPDKKQEHPSN
jgi:hypothetical protein